MQIFPVHAISQPTERSCFCRYVYSHKGGRKSSNNRKLILFDQVNYHLTLRFAFALARPEKTYIPDHIPAQYPKSSLYHVTAPYPFAFKEGYIKNLFPVLIFVSPPGLGGQRIIVFMNPVVFRFRERDEPIVQYRVPQFKI